MKRVLVTGASGFMGRHTLVPLKTNGFEVHAVGLRNFPQEGKYCNWHVANLLEKKSVKTLIEKVHPTHLLHLAWNTESEKYWTSDENFLWVQASEELLRRFQEFGGERAVMVGSCAEYEALGVDCVESVTPAFPHSVYGVAKKALQEFLEGFSKKTGLSSAWARIFFLYGPHEPAHRFVPSLIRSLLQAQFAVCDHENKIRDYLYIQDSADALVKILLSETQGPINVASGQPVLLKTIVKIIAEKLHRQDLLQLRDLPDSLQVPQRLVADISRLRNEIGWNQKYDLEKGLDQTIKWWIHRLSQTVGENGAKKFL